MAMAPSLDFATIKSSTLDTGSSSTALKFFSRHLASCSIYLSVLQSKTYLRRMSSTTSSTAASTAVPLMCTLQTCPISYAIITYFPSLAGNVLYLAIFAMILVSQLFLGIRYRTWGFLTGMTCGLLCEVLGYAGRVWYRTQPFGQPAFLM